MLTRRPALNLSCFWDLAVPKLRTVIYSVRWHDRRTDLAVVRRYLHCQEAAFSATHQVESYAHAMRERFGVIAGSFFGHDRRQRSIKQRCSFLTT